MNVVPRNFPVSVKVPGEQRGSGMGAGVAAINQGIAQDELQSAIGALLGVGPSGSVAVARPHADFGKLILQVLVLKALLHALLVEQLQVFSIHDLGRAIHQQQTVVGIRAQRIDDPGDIHRTDGVKPTHDSHVAVALAVEHLSKGHRRGRRSRLRHLGDKALGKAGRLRSVVAGFVGIGEERGRHLPDIGGTDLARRQLRVPPTSRWTWILGNRRTN